MSTGNNKKAYGYWSNRFESKEVYQWTVNKWTTINQRTINGKYSNQPAAKLNPQHKSYLAKGIKIDMQQEEFFDWCKSKESEILEMMVNGERPSIDRICDECDYSIENIKIIPLIENISKDAKNLAHSSRGKTEYTLHNRRAYINSHVGYAYKELVIDHYIKNYPLKLVLETIDLGYIKNWNESKVKDDSLVEIDSEAVLVLEAKMKTLKDIEAKELKLVEERLARIAGRKSRQEAEANRKADKVWAKSLPEYADFTKEVSKARDLLVLSGTTVQKEVIRQLKVKYGK